MIVAYLASCLHCTWHALAASPPVDNPAPQNPVSGSNGVNLLIGYAKWGALIACAYLVAIKIVVSAPLAAS